MQARAAVMPDRQGRWTLETLEVAEPGPQEVLVRVVASGICQTDVHARDGFFPIPYPAVTQLKNAKMSVCVSECGTRRTLADASVVMLSTWTKEPRQDRRTVRRNALP